MQQCENTSHAEGAHAPLSLIFRGVNAAAKKLKAIKCGVFSQIMQQLLNKKPKNWTFVLF